ncbi:hypothetical protein HN371_23040, partial [Candidatus Poribacteria bacterium]|nr:hypothetical protein [Candidatus Poribacteria bacterium]
ERRLTLNGHPGGVLAITVSRDGKRIVTGSPDHTAKLWDAESGTEIRTFRGHASSVLSVTLSVDGRRLVTSSSDNTAKLWDVKSGTEIRTFRGHTGSVLSVTLSVDGRRLVTGSNDNSAKLWDVESGTEIRAFKGHTGWVRSVALSVDGRRLVTGSHDNTSKLWHVESGTEIRAFERHTGWIRSVALSIDGRRLVTGSWDTNARLWDIESGRKLRDFRGHTSSVQSVALSVDGRRLVTGSNDNTVKLWDVGSGAELQAFGGVTSGVNAVAISHDDQMIVAAAAQGTVHIWRLATQHPVAIDTASVTPIPDGATSPRSFGIVRIKGVPTLLEPSANRSLDAEEEGVISLTLTNQGRGEAEQVEVAITLLSDTQHLTYPAAIKVGTISPDHEMPVRIPVRASIDVADDTARFRIVVTEKWGFEPDPRILTFQTRAFSPPELVVDDGNVGIDDDKKGDSFGDNDGRIEKQEAIEVTFVVQNIGVGVAEGVTANITLDGMGRDIYAGSDLAFDLGNIGAGDFRRVTFAFVTNARYSRSEATATAAISERRGQYGVSKALTFPLDTLVQRDRDVVVEPIVVDGAGGVVALPPRLTSAADDVPKNAIPQFRNAVAVIFGIEEYRNAADAKYANRDATVFHEYATTVLGIEERNIHLAVNDNATKGTFDKVFGEDGWIERRVTGGETDVFLFYSGHGAPARDESAYLIPQDADPNYAATAGVALSDIYASLNALQARHVTVFVDSCFSGGGRHIEGEGEAMLLADAKPIVWDVREAASYENMTVMTASSGSQISSAYRAEKHGLFTYHLLMGLRGDADVSPKDGRVTTQELGDYLSINVPNTALSALDREQNPTIRTDQSDRVLAVYE